MAVKLARLQPRIASTSLTRVAPLTVERLRGRRAVERNARWLAAHPHCAKCLELGRQRLATEVDHIVPLHLGGKDDESNFQSVCHPCHADKTGSEATARAGGG